jgi:phosphatidate phosphatase APP1
VRPGPSLRRAKVRTLGPADRVLLFATAACLTEDDASWHVPVRGWVFQPREDAALRRAAQATLRRFLRMDPASAESVLLAERLRWFLVHSSKRVSVTVRVAGQVATLGPSDHQGHFGGSVQVPVDAANRAARSGVLEVEAHSPAGPSTAISLLVGREGLSLISDIDDTLKVSGVRDKRALLRNTLLGKFRAPEGMPALCRRFQQRGAALHLVSASPWQLYQPLADFFRAELFPPASFALKRVRLRDSTVFNLFADPAGTKRPAIEDLLADYPGRRFCLLGDTGEHDPETYAELWRKHPQQVVCVYLRNVTGETADMERYRGAFAGLDPERWRLFTDPSELGVPV